jgi:molybdenum cofactor cytidylyltransferase
MGAFKPLLPFGGRTVIEACVENLRAGGVERVVVVVGHRGDEIVERLAHHDGVSFAVNREAESEMGVSIARGVERIPDETEALFIALADHPAVGPEVIRLLIEERRRKRARLLVPEHEGRGGHPVLVDHSFREELLGLDPQRGLRALFDAHREEVLRVPVDSPYVARDINTWEDYLALYEDVFRLRPSDQR